MQRHFTRSAQDQCWRKRLSVALLRCFIAVDYSGDETELLWRSSWVGSQTVGYFSRVLLWDDREGEFHILGAGGVLVRDVKQHQLRKLGASGFWDGHETVLLLPS